MTTYPINTEDIISDFLRVHLTDPRARAEASTTDSFSATAGQTTRTITRVPSGNSVSCITSITVNGTAINKWLDYFWDYQNEQVTFFSALSLNDAVVITYKYGTSNWIYSDKPQNDLKATNFPRISCFMVSGSGRRLGNYEAPVESNSVIQIDIWVRKNYIKTISSKTYSGEYLGRYLGLEVTKAFEDNEDDLFPVLYNYIPIGIPAAAPYSEEYQAYHTVVQVRLNGLKLGRIVK